MEDNLVEVIFQRLDHRLGYRMIEAFFSWMSEDYRYLHCPSGL
jgi:hypothetical protein